MICSHLHAPIPSDEIANGSNYRVVAVKIQELKV